MNKYNPCTDNAVFKWLPPLLQGPLIIIAFVGVSVLLLILPRTLTHRWNWA